MKWKTFLIVLEGLSFGEFKSLIKIGGYKI